MAIADPSSETTERQQLVRFALRDGDPFTIVHLLETLDLRTRETADLLFAFEMLRSRNFPIDDLSAWSGRARVLSRSCPRRWIHAACDPEPKTIITLSPRDAGDSRPLPPAARL